jgi:hypothetical protein
MTAFPGIPATPMRRYEVIVERLQCTPFVVTVPAFSQEDAIERITAGASKYGYYDFIKAYAPDERGDGRREGEDGRRSS